MSRRIPLAPATAVALILGASCLVPVKAAWAGVANAPLDASLAGQTPLSLPQALQIAAAEAASSQKNTSFSKLNPGKVILKRSAIVSSQTIRLGDLFSGLSAAQADEVVAAAPTLGEPLVIEAARLSALARAHGVEWIPTSASDKVTITRDSISIGQTEIASLLHAPLVSEGVGENAELEFSSSVPVVAVPSESLSAITITALDFNRMTRAFTAQIDVPSGGQVPQRIRVSGRAIETTDIAVLTRPVSRKDVIGPDDVAFITMPSGSVQGAIASRPSDLIGKSARRDLRPGQPLFARDLETPAAVTKGQAVALVYQVPGMTLTARGIALTDGAPGRQIRVQNAQSNKTVIGVVIDSQTVSVGIGTQTAAIMR